MSGLVIGRRRLPLQLQLRTTLVLIAILTVLYGRGSVASVLSVSSSSLRLTLTLIPLQSFSSSTYICKHIIHCFKLVVSQSTRQVSKFKNVNQTYRPKLSQSYE